MMTMNNQDEINLINFFTHNKNLTRAQRERFASLVARDLIHSDTKVEKNEEVVTYYHSPKKMIEFLSLFSRDDRFKWFTHKWDMSKSFSIKEMRMQQRVTRKMLNNMVYSPGLIVNEQTYNQVWNFINLEEQRIGRPNKWKNTEFENISYGWHSIVKLCSENPNVPVEHLKLENGRQFKDYIRMFKSTIEFRTDLREEDRFSELIWKNINSALPKDFKVEYTSNFNNIGYDLNIYCDVLGILSALQIICNWIVRHKSKSSEVYVDLISEDEYYILKINHKGSFLNNIEKLENPSGDLDELRKRLFSVCDFSMEGDFNRDGQSQGSLMINALDSDTSMREREKEKKLGMIKIVAKIFLRIIKF